MRKIADIKKELAEGSQWLVTESNTTALYRIVKTQTNGFWLQGPLPGWKVRRLPWPLLRQTKFLPDGDGFTTRLERRNLTFKETGHETEK